MFASDILAVMGLTFALTTHLVDQGLDFGFGLWL